MSNAISVDELSALRDAGITIVDARPATIFTKGFIPGSLFFGMEGNMADWASKLLAKDKELVLVAPQGAEAGIAENFTGAGFKVKGWLNGSFEAWQQAGKPIDMIIDIEPDELLMDIKHDPQAIVVDVRNMAEYAEGHLEGADHLPLTDMTDLAQIAGFEEDQQLYIHCAGGYRSVIAASLLKKHGLHNLRNVLGGFSKIKLEEGAKIEKQPTSLN